MGFEFARQAAPRSRSSTSMHSTSRRTAPPPAKWRVTAPDGSSPPSKVSASKCQGRILLLQVEPVNARRRHSLKAQAGATALVGSVLVGCRTLPIEAVGNHRKSHILPQVSHVADADHRILEVAGEHLQILRIEGDQLQVFHTAASLRSNALTRRAFNVLIAAQPQRCNRRSPAHRLRWQIKPYACL